MAKKAPNHTATPKGEHSFFCRVQDAFRVIAHKSSSVLGTAWAFIVAVAVIVVWAATGRLFHYSDTWQLIINTGTTIVTFLMVFLIQNTQNRESRAVQLKLDELIRSMRGARNKLMDLEALTDEDLDDFEKEFRRLRKRAEQTAETVTQMSKGAKSR
ncbi:MAG TPA: low affinity iron permease family protein [Chthoniobacterales bacterium]|jgi:low affinity Fe/Cu permease